MVLQNISRNLKNRDWGAAAIEIGIVVIGIFIGLQVDDWNNARKDRVTENQYLQRLHEDVHTLVELQAERVANRLEIHEHLGDAADILIGVSAGGDWNQDQCNAVANSHIYSPLPTAVPTLNELLATGRMILIRDIPLRDALTRLQIQVDRSAELLARIDGSVRVLPRFHPDVIRDELVPNTDDADRRHDTRPICDLQAAKSDPQFMTDFADNVSRHDAYASSGLRGTHDMFEELDRLLAKALAIENHAAGGFTPATSGAAGQTNP